ncbi:MAG: hypothetical protein M3P32_08010 [Chloroflexota bacterium]|nr:hypothetical protein [Chloroflexota bacterium]
MTLGELLAEIGQRLDAAAIPYMVTGSVASSFHGEPRATRDIDIVVDPTPQALDAFVRSLPADAFYVDLGAARTALAERGQFNVIESASGWKADLVIRKDRPFSIEEFARRQPVALLGTATFIASPEDLIIAKLEWAKFAESERQLRDVTAILAVSGDRLDYRYIERWVSALGLRDVWSRIHGAIGAEGQ